MGIKVSNIRKEQIVFLDSNIFIYALENNSSLGEQARAIFSHISQKAPQVFTSVLTIQEVLPKIFENGLEDKLSSYLEFIQGNGLITILNFERNMAIEAARLRAQYKSLRAPDAIQIATALSTKAQFFITADKRIPKRIKSLEVLSLN